MTFVIYGVFVLIEIILHMVRISRYESMEGQALKNAGQTDRRLVLLMDALQLPLSLVFTRFLNVFSDYIPQFGEGENTPGSYVLRLLVLIVCNYSDGDRGSHVLEYAYHPKSGRWDCTGDCRLCTQKVWDLPRIVLTF